MFNKIALLVGSVLLIALLLFFNPKQNNDIKQDASESVHVFPTPIPSPTIAPERFKNELTSVVSGYREKNGLSLLTESTQTCAIAAARLIEVHDDWSHNGFHKYSGFASTYQGENLAKEYLTPKDVVDHWIASPTHKENLDRSIWNHMCIATDGNYVVQIFSD